MSLSRHPTRHFLPILALAIAGLTQLAHAQASPFDKITWTTGPAKVNVGSNATIDLPKDYRFTDENGARQFMEITQNLSHGELGVLLPPKDSPDEWFMIFSFDDVGYVKDDEKLDDAAINAILSSIKSGTESSNAEKKSKGWDPLIIDGWSHRPFYDNTTHSLTWGVAAHSGTDKIVNYDARVLGRRGVLRCKLVLGPEELATAVPKFQKVITAIAFTQGETYAEFQSGDKLAKYGLVGLMTGVGAVAAVKFWKPLVAIGALVLGGIVTVFKKIKGIFTGNK